MADILYVEQTCDFIKNSNDDIYCADPGETVVILTEGDLYTVFWDGVRYVCIAEAVTLSNGLEAVGIGNKSIEGLGEDSGEPFLIGYAAEYAASVFETLDTAATHTVAIYRGETEEPEETPEETPVEEKNSANIVLYDRNGNPVTYEDIETVTFNTDEDEKTATYTFGTAVNDVPVELDLSDGDQTVKAAAGKMIKSAVVKKPETLLPENIKKGVEIAGVEGELIGEGVSKAVELDFSNGDQIVVPDEETLLSEVVIQKPENLLPENIKENENVAGVVGTMMGGDAFIKAFAEKTLSGIVENANVVKIDEYAFFKMNQIGEVSFPECSLINTSAFANCEGMLKANFPKASYVGTSAFYNCYNLEQITLGCNSNFYTEIRGGTFQYCNKLSEIKYMYSSSFVDGYVLLSYNGAFKGCSNLKEIRIMGKGDAFDSLNYQITDSSFDGCNMLSVFAMSGALGTMRTEIANVSGMSSCEVGSYAFRSCSSLTELSLTIRNSAGFTVGAYAFASCIKLEHLWLNFTSIPSSSISLWFSLASSAFYNTPFSTSSLLGRFGSIHVTKNAYAYLRTAKGWSSYAARMVSY